MAVKPTIADARWATGPAALVTPSGGERDTGFVAGTPIVSGLVDYLINQAYQWFQYLSDAVFSGPATFEDAVTCEQTLQVDGDLTVGDDLTVTDDASIGGDLVIGASSASGTLLSSDGTTLTSADRIAAPRMVTSSASPYCHLADELLRVPVLSEDATSVGRIVDPSNSFVIPEQINNLSVVSSYAVEGFCTDSGNITVDLVGITATGAPVVDTVVVAVTAGLPFFAGAGASQQVLEPVAIAVSTGTAECVVRSARVGYNRPPP